VKENVKILHLIETEVQKKRRDEIGRPMSNAIETMKRSEKTLKIIKFNRSKSLMKRKEQNRLSYVNSDRATRRREFENVTFKNKQKV
jgi:hypothetical protein